MKQLKAVIFDVDGTLAETERDGHRAAFNRAFESAGLDWYWDEQLYGELLAVTGGKERIKFYLENYYKHPDFKGDLSELINRLHADKTRFYVDLLASKAIDLRPGVERLIHEIRETGLRLAIATTTTPANVTALLNSTLGTESVQWFDCIAAGDVVAAKKPAGDIFSYCLQQLGLNASDCLAVEDSGNGVKAAVAAGLTTIVTTSSYTGQEDFSGAISVFDTLGDDVCPCQTLAGIKIDNTMVTVNDLKDLHEKNHR